MLFADLSGGSQEEDETMKILAILFALQITAIAQPSTTFRDCSNCPGLVSVPRLHIRHDSFRCEHRRHGNTTATLRTQCIEKLNGHDSLHNFANRGRRFSNRRVGRFQPTRDSWVHHFLTIRFTPQTRVLFSICASPFQWHRAPKTRVQRRNSTQTDAM